MTICLFCNKPVAPSLATQVVGAIVAGLYAIIASPRTQEQCSCSGTRCNICGQIYQGLAGDCLCTDITEEDYKQAGVRAGLRAGDD